MALTTGSPINVDYETNGSSWQTIYSSAISPGDTVAVVARALARKATNGDCAFWEKRALFRRDDTDPAALIGSVLDIFTPIKTLGATIGGWDFRLRSDNDEYFYVDVKGGSGVDVGWVVFGEAVVLDYPV